MIRALLAIGDRKTAKNVYAVVALAALNGVMQGVALAALVPILVALLQGDISGAWSWTLVLAIACLVNAIFVVLSIKRSFTVSMDVIEDMHRKLGEEMVQLPLGWFSAGAAARASHIVVRGTMFVALAASDALIPVVTAIATPIAVSLVAFFFDWTVGLALVGAIIVIMGVSKLTSRRGITAERTVHEASLETDQRLLEFAESQMVLRSAGIRGGGYQPLADAIEERKKAGRRSVIASIIGMVPQG